MDIPVSIMLTNNRHEEVTIRLPAGFVIERQMENNMQRIALSREYIFKLSAYSQKNVVVRGRLLKGDTEEASQETAPSFTLPEQWQTQPPILHPALVQLPTKPGETARQTLSTYFQRLAENEERGIGGKELMVAMNEDLLEQGNRSQLEDFIPAYHPASFDFQFATGDNSLVSHALQGIITISEVVLGSTPNQVRLYDQEGH